MLIVKAFTDNRYISPEDEINIYYEIPLLINFWITVVLEHSSDKMKDLPSDKLLKLTAFLNDSKIKFNETKTIGPQLDRKVVEMILWAAVKSGNVAAVDRVYSKTKNSIFNYFYYELIIDAYLKLNNESSAIEVINCLYGKHHIACLYAILKCKESENENHTYYNEKLRSYKETATLELLSKGEKVDLFQVSLGDLIRIIENVYAKVQ